MPANYVLLEKITVGAAGASSVTFSSIPQTGYTDLVVKVSARQDSATVAFSNLRFNGSTTGYSYRDLQGDGSGASSASGSTATYGVTNLSTWTANTFNSIDLYIPNYAGSNYKSWSSDSVTEANISTVYSDFVAGLWSNTAAINQVTLYPNGGNFAQYTTFYLYGVAKLGTTPAIVPYATGGDTIMTDGTYWYHTFLSSGTFTPAKALSCDYLVVAGGGSGGRGNNSGGGGAGGLRSTVTATGGGGSLETALALASGTGYTVTIGGGGAIPSSGASGNNGSNSVFSTITSTGGGGGGKDGVTGLTGGSGGGNPFDIGSTPTNGTANQGYRGGAGVLNSPAYGAGGGGGAGAVGASATDFFGGNGGAGVATSISGSSVTYAGGGGGAAQATIVSSSGGSGGGGNGAGLTAAGSGTANTGSGGGGTGNSAGGSSGSGGSGIVIVRYAI